MFDTVVMVGTGAMGSPMALRLAESGFQVRAVVRSDVKRAEELSSAGIAVLREVADPSASGSVYVLALPTRADKLDNIYDAANRTWKIPRESTIIDCSTISPRAAVELRESFAGSDIDYVECPVSGGPMGARTGSLTGLVVGDADVLSRVSAVLDSLLAQQILTGGPGSAQTMKLLNNVILAAAMAANAETLAVARRNGLDLALVRDVVLASSGSNWQMENIVPKTILQDDFDPLYSLNNLVKDLTLFEEMSHSEDLPVSASVITRYRDALAAFGGDADFSSIFKLSFP